MSDEKQLLDDLISNLKQQRDELALQIHLGKEEAKVEWEKVQEKLTKLSGDYEPVRNAVGESASNIFESLKLVAGEVKDSFDRIWESFSEDEDKNE